QEERTLRRERPAGRLDPRPGPVQIPLARQRVVIASVAHVEVVGRRRDDYRNRPGRERTEHVEAVTEIEPQRAASGVNLSVGLRKPGRFRDGSRKPFGLPGYGES